MIYLEGRRTLIQDLDVATLLSDLTSEIARLVESGDSDCALRIWTLWEECSGDNLELAADAVRSVRGYAGYQAECAKFSRTQVFRRSGLEWLQRGIMRGDGEVIVRWRWVARSYAKAVLRFARARRATMDNEDLANHARDDTRGSAFRAFPAHQASLESRRRYLSNPVPVPPERSGHNLNRVLDLAASVSVAAKRREALAAERDRWRDRTESSVGARLNTRDISRMPSLSRQIDAYRSIVKRSERDEERQRYCALCDAVETQLAQLRNRRSSVLLQQVGTLPLNALDSRNQAGGSEKGVSDRPD